jgi:hypothetical protein
MSDSRKRQSGPDDLRAKKTHTSDETGKLPTDRVAEFIRVRRELLQLLDHMAMTVDKCDPVDQDLPQLASHLNAMISSINVFSSERNKLVKIIHSTK